MIAPLRPVALAGTAGWLPPDPAEGPTGVAVALGSAAVRTGALAGTAGSFD
jgi:hypothetical protein